MDAVKIRCRNRRTFSSACRQSIWRQSSDTSSGPLTATLVAASSLSSGSGITDFFLFTDSPDRVSPLSRPGTLARYPAGYPPRSAGGLINRDGFPLPFGHRHSLLGHPVPAGELGSPRGRLTEPQVRTPTGLPRSARTSCDQGGRPLDPGDNGAHPDRGDYRPGARRFAAASPCTPPYFPPDGDLA